MKLHKSCDTLPIYNFSKILEEDALEYLIVGYNDLEDKKVKIKNISDAIEVLGDIMIQYNVLSDNKKALSNKRKIFDINYLKYVLMALEKIIEPYEKYAIYQQLELLNDLGYSFDKSRDHEEQVEKIRKKILGIKNKIRINEASLLNLNKDSKNDVKINLEKQATRLEVGLGLGYQLDTRVISVSKWISLSDINKEKAESYGVEH